MIGIPVLVCLVAIVYYEIFEPWKYAEEDKASYPYPELYEIPDTTIYSHAPVDIDSGFVIIPIENLPIRNYSFKQIMEQFGSEAMHFKAYENPAEDFPYQWSSLPRAVAEKCDNLGAKTIYKYRIAYKDSDDVLLLWVYEEDNDVKILWGLRTNPEEFNI